MTLLVRTARISTTAPDALNVTRKSAGPDGLPFAPSWAILNAALAARRNGYGAEHWPTYEAAYRSEMLRSYREQRAAWDALLARESVTLTCYCARTKDGELRCHRVLLAGFLVRLGAHYDGEVDEQPTGQLELGAVADDGGGVLTPPSLVLLRTVIAGAR